LQSPANYGSSHQSQCSKNTGEPSLLTQKISKHIRKKACLKLSGATWDAIPHLP